jgi:tetratricopeptide (TPR) repeat protein
MFRWGILAGAFVSCAATVAVAQTTARPTDPVFVRAQALVSDGNGVAGRALIDSVLAATQPSALLYPEALFWRATLASNAADAESDYKHLVVDYPLAPQAEDALLRLAQLELARGDRDGALAHLQRIPRDYPRSKSLARASYWTARVLFEKNDIPNACAANGNALSRVGADEIELKNQIQYQGQRCPLPAASIASVKAPTIDTATPSTPSTANIPSPPAPTSPGTPKDIKAVDTVPAKSASPASVASPAIKTEATAATVAPIAPVARSATSTSSASIYSVQVAAYNHKGDAAKLAAGLVKRGYAARVDGDVVPFRVRIGRYSTAGEAEKALAKIKAKHMSGFVVRAPKGE